MTGIFVFDDTEQHCSEMLTVNGNHPVKVMKPFSSPSWRGQATGADLTIVIRVMCYLFQWSMVKLQWSSMFQESLKLPDTEECTHKLVPYYTVHHYGIWLRAVLDFFSVSFIFS